MRYEKTHEKVTKSGPNKPGSKITRSKQDQKTGPKQDYQNKTKTKAETK